MAYAQWLVPSKTSGSGNDTVNVTAGADNTGRNSRQTTMTFKAANCPDVERTVIQAGKPEFVTIESAKSVDKAGVATLTISGVTNSSKLTFALASGGSRCHRVITPTASRQTTVQPSVVTQERRRSSPSR